MKKLDPTKKYVLAVSGGMDSMCMLHLFVCHKPKLRFSVVTVNHGIRPEAADDCKFVADYCRQNGVECAIECVDVPTYAAEHKLSTETAARILRYNVLDNVDADYICLAHHMSDNAETVLMHILRGSGANGAEGIREQNGRYLRPLLDMTRDEIFAYVCKNHVPYVTDSTNADIAYKRNYIRNEVMPRLKTAYPDAECAIARFAANIAEDNAYLCSLAYISTVDFGANYTSARIPITLLTQHLPIAKRVLYKVFAEMGVYRDIESVHVAAIVDLAKSHGGAKLDLPFGFVAYNDYTHITLTCMSNDDVANEIDTKGTDNAPLTTKSGTLNDINCDFCVPFSVGVTQTPFGKVVVTHTPTKGALRCDLAKIPSDAVVRTIRSGDVFTKFGGGTKPLNRYLIDKKIPQRNRAKLPLIATGNKVLVVCGVEISDEIKITDGKDTIYIFTED